MGKAMHGKRERSATKFCYACGSPRGALMRWFTRKNSEPSWNAAFARPKDAAHFKNLVIEDLRRRGIKVSFEQGHARIEGEGKLAGGRFGLENPARRCAGLPRSEWPKAIDEHFSGLIARASRDLTLPQTWDEAAGKVCIRLWDADHPPDRIHESVVAEHVCGLLSTLFVNAGKMLLGVSPSDLERWNVDADTAFAAAIHNLPRIAPLHRIVPERSDGVPDELYFLVGETPCGASWLVDPGSILSSDAAGGVLVSAPVREALVVCPLTRANVMRAVRAIQIVTQSMYDSEPGAVSSRVFWWHQDRLEPLGLSKQAEDVNFTPSPRFAEMLGTLL